MNECRRKQDEIDICYVQKNTTDFSFSAAARRETSLYAIYGKGKGNRRTAQKAHQTVPRVFAAAETPSAVLLVSPLCPPTSPPALFFHPKNASYPHTNADHFFFANKHCIVSPGCARYNCITLQKLLNGKIKIFHGFLVFNCDWN